MVACSSTNSTIIEVEPTSTLINENSTTTSTNVPPMALDSINTSTTTIMPLFTLDENCDENYPKYSKQRRDCWSFKTNEMWEKCENPLSESCFLEYNPTEVSYWEMGYPFWAEQIGFIYSWSEHYAYWNLDWPQELVDIVYSPAFSIRDNGCLLYKSPSPRD